jgi:hypothetical protein
MGWGRVYGDFSLYASFCREPALTVLRVYGYFGDFSMGWGRVYGDFLLYASFCREPALTVLRVYGYLGDFSMGGGGFVEIFRCMLVFVVNPPLP